MFVKGMEAINPSSLIQKAERLFEESLYMDALPLYQDLSTMHSGNDLKLRVVECQLELQQTEKALLTLASFEEPLDPSCQIHKTYLSAYAERQAGHYKQAVELLQPYIQSSYLKNEIQLELGLNYFYLDQLPQAYLAFSAVDWDPHHPNLSYLARLYLARLALKEGKEIDGKWLQDHLPTDHRLQFEWSYLQGLVHFQAQNYIEAAHFFEKALPTRSSDCQLNTLNYLAHCYLKQIEPLRDQPEKLSFVLKQTEEILNRLILLDPTESDYFNLVTCYLNQFYYLKNSYALYQAQKLLVNPTWIQSMEGKCQALLLQTEIAPDLSEKNKLYQQLILLLEKEDESQHTWALKFKALAYYHLNQTEAMEQIWTVLYKTLTNPQSLTPLHEELYELVSLFVNSLKPEKNPDLFKQVEAIWQQGIRLTSNRVLSKHLLKELALFYIRTAQWKLADQTLVQFIDTIPDASEAWFLRAHCAEQEKDEQSRQCYLKQVYERYPQSPYAPMAYFNYYSYRDYMHGSRKAIKHLQAMVSLFPNHPWIVQAYYLIGLYNKKDHFSLEGKIQHHRHWVAAIDAFQQAESLFDLFYAKNLFSSLDLSHFIHVRYRANLERAQANLSIANESQGSKQQIYLSYAEEVFKQIVEDYYHPHSLLKEANDLSILEESELGLVQIVLKKREFNLANQILDRLLALYQQLNIKQGYFLSRVWYEKGCIAQQQQEFEQAIPYFLEAELTAKGLSIDQKLDLWIQKSLCYKELRQFDEAMRILSNVVNDEAISGLRLKAMYLRASVYEAQERPELAIKQLEATAKKGGEWGKKAQRKLEEEYGY